MGTSNRFDKTPTGTLDYRLDLIDWLGDGETVSSAISTPDSSDITVASTSTASTNVTIRVSGGVVGNLYVVNVQVTTNTGEIETFPMEFYITPK